MREGEGKVPCALNLSFIDWTANSLAYLSGLGRPRRNELSVQHCHNVVSENEVPCCVPDCHVVPARFGNFGGSKVASWV